MDLISPEEGEYVVINHPSTERKVLRVVITEATTEIALALMYRIFSDNVFGSNQLIFISLYDCQDKAAFLESVEVELTEFCPNLLQGVSYSTDISIAFKDADVVLSIGLARGYEFPEEEYTDSFFEESVLVAKFHGEAIERYAKKDVKVIVLGNTAATVIAQYAKSVSSKNITGLSLFNTKMAAAHIADHVNCHPSQIKNIIIWGNNKQHSFPDCRYMYFKNDKIITDKVQVWMKYDLPGIIQAITNRSLYTRSIAYALADHCKILWNGTPEDEWTCMSVLSDKSYGIQSGIFFSYPVHCENKEYEIVKNLADDEYVEEQTKHISKMITIEVNAALKVCGLK